MALTFITGNINKFEEAKAVFPTIEQLDIDLPEIQDTDAKNIIAAKLREAFNHSKGEFIVEDTSLCFSALNGLPGPFIKWFLGSLGTAGLVNLAQKMGNDKAEAVTVIGYAQNPRNISFFEGRIRGRIVSPIGITAFGWDPIFVPDGFEKTFAEMNKEEKNAISMRRLALEQLKAHLDISQ